jgi:3-deoxy-D-manno-octulosonate 8-phosphate phosphatase KdsC-like HAD superfamily phosphatase
MDSIPMVVISGQVSSAVIGNDAFQEVDAVGITRSCVKHNFLVTDINDLANMCSCGWSFSPANATDAIKIHSDILLMNNSGDKAIREVTEFIEKYNWRYEKYI